MLRGFNLMKQLEESKTVIGLNMLRLWDDRRTLEPWIAPLTKALNDGTILPIVHAIVPFAEAPEAHRILAARRTSARWCWYREAMGGPGPGCLVSAAAKQLYSRIPVSNNVLWNLQ